MEFECYPTFHKIIETIRLNYTTNIQRDIIYDQQNYETINMKYSWNSMKDRRGRYRK